MQETAMNWKVLAAAAAGLCLTWGGAYAGPAAPDTTQDLQPQASSPANVPEAVGATNDIIVLELGPMQGGPASAEDMAAMQMLLLQLLMIQSEMGAAGGEMPMLAPAPNPGVGI
jgi:hypothetical protein